MRITFSDVIQICVLVVGIIDLFIESGKKSNR